MSDENETVEAIVTLPEEAADIPSDVRERMRAFQASLVAGEERVIDLPEFPVRSGEEKPYALMCGFPLRVQRLAISRGVTIVEMSLGPAAQGRRSKDPKSTRTRMYFTPEEIAAGAFRAVRVLAEDSITLVLKNDSGDDMELHGKLLVTVDPVPTPEVEWR